MKPKRTINYKPKNKKIFGQEKWVATMVTKKQISFDTVCHDVAKFSSAEVGEVRGLMLAYLDRIRTHVLEGEGVNVEGFGTFYPRLTTKMVEDPKEVSIANCVKNVVIGFRPNSKFLEKVKDADIVLFKGATDSFEEE